LESGAVCELAAFVSFSLYSPGAILRLLVYYVPEGVPLEETAQPGQPFPL
jgi:hypothetical protein